MNPTFLAFAYLIAFIVMGLAFMSYADKAKEAAEDRNVAGVLWYGPWVVAFVLAGLSYLHKFVDLLQAQP